MEKDTEKCLNNEGNLQMNQQLLGVREVLRGVVAKEQAETTNERMYFSQCNKALVKKGAILRIECWDKRQEVLHDPEVQKQQLTKEAKEIKTEERSRVIENHNICVSACSNSEDTDSIQKMARQVKSSKVFKKNTKKCATGHHKFAINELRRKIKKE